MGIRKTNPQKLIIQMRASGLDPLPKIMILRFLLRSFQIKASTV